MAPTPPIDPRTFIRANLPLVAVATIPEIELHRATPSSGVGRIASGTPYWAYPWPGGVGLARHILDHPETVRGRRVLDLGAGSGLVAIAAAKAGAASVVAADPDPLAQAASLANADANGVVLDICADDLLDGDPPATDLVMAGDVFYERRFARRALAFLERCAAAGIEVLIGDVGRAFLPRDHLREVAAYPAVEFGRPSDTRSTCRVFTLAVTPKSL